MPDSNKEKLLSFGARIAGIFLLLIVQACSTKRSALPKIELLDYYAVPGTTYVDSTWVGGLSGIDYVPLKDTYVAISDDRAEHGPARFYEFSLRTSSGKIDALVFKQKTLILDKEKQAFQKQTIDAEAVRVHPENPEKIFYADEGGMQGVANISVLSLNGQFQNAFSIPQIYLKALRPNKAFESLAISEEGRNLFFAPEASLTIDGGLSTTEASSLVRIFKYSIDSQRIEKQYAYELSKVPLKGEKETPWGGAAEDIGLAELFYLNEDQLLTLERAGIYQEDGSFHFFIKCYLVNLESRKGEGGLYKTTKHLLLDFNQLEIPIYNIEGMTWGKHVNGKRTLVFVSDNNFSGEPTFIYWMTFE